MSTIGSGPGIGTGPQPEVTPARAINPTRAISPPGGGGVAGAPVGPRIDPGGTTSQPPPAAAQAGATMVSTSVASAGTPPINSDRVVAIRKAIQNGSYPLLPTKISDAMIAAGMVLRIPR